MVMMEPEDLREREDHLELMDTQATLEIKVTKVIQDLQERKEMMGTRV